MSTFSGSSKLCVFLTHNRPGLDLKIQQGGIPLLTPSELASELQSLPPKLDRQNSKSIPSCSKAPRGLTVFS